MRQTLSLTSLYPLCGFMRVGGPQPAACSTCSLSLGLAPQCLRLPLADVSGSLRLPLENSTQRLLRVTYALSHGAWPQLSRMASMSCTLHSFRTITLWITVPSFTAASGWSLWLCPQDTFLTVLLCPSKFSSIDTDIFINYSCSQHCCFEASTSMIH